jgi:hypothetical protein
MRGSATLRHAFEPGSASLVELDAGCGDGGHGVGSGGAARRWDDEDRKEKNVVSESGSWVEVREGGNAVSLGIGTSSLIMKYYWQVSGTLQRTGKKFCVSLRHY